MVFYMLEGELGVRASPPIPGHDWIVISLGEGTRVADLQSFNVLRNWYKAFAPDVFRSEYPRLDDFVQHIERLPSIQTYIEDDQEPTTWFQWPQAALRLTSPEELQAIKV